MDLKSQWEAYEASKRVHHIADKETAERLNIEIGSEYTTFPEPKTKEEAFERLEKHTGLIALDNHIRNFERTFDKSKRTLSDQLEKLQSFIDRAEKISTADAFKHIGISFNNRYHYEYLKWKYGFYKKQQFYGYSTFFPSELIEVYSKYVLFKKWLEEQIIELTPKQNKRLSIQKPDPKFRITPFAQIKRELNTIHWVFTSQFMSKSTNMSLPMIRDDGRYCANINIRSNYPLYNIEEYKFHFTERFENAHNNIAVKNELIDVYEKAVILRDYFNENLTDRNPIVQKFLDLKEGNLFVTPEMRSYYFMRIVVDNYNPQDILFGEETITNEFQDDWTLREYNYQSDNRQLAEFCKNLIEFIDKFNLTEISIPKDDLEVKGINSSQNSKEPFETDMPKNIDISTYTIIDKMFQDVEFVDDISYENLKKSLAGYFTNGNIPTNLANIKFSRINRKKIGSKFNQLHKKFNKSIGLDFCKFCVQNINLWEMTSIEDENKFRNSRIYKDCHDNSF